MHDEAWLDERKLCRENKLFLAERLGYDFKEEVHGELFKEYITYDDQKPWAEQSGVTKRLILWPRGHFKTTSVVVEIIQCIINFPDIRILIMQGTVKVTVGLLHEIKSHFNQTNTKSQFGRIFPDFCGDDRQLHATSQRFTTPERKNKGLQQATVTVASPKAVKTGQHYDIGFFDDLVNDQNYRNPALLEKVRQDYTMCLPLIDPPHYVNLSGTRYAFGDLYEVVMKTQQGWNVSVRTCFKEDKSPLFPQFKTADGRLVGFTVEGLQALFQADPVMFASQYLNHPVQQGGQRFTEALLDSALIYSKDAPALSDPVMFVDLAASDKEYSDDSVILIGKQDQKGTSYVVDLRGDQWLPGILAHNIIEAVLMWRPLRIYFEKSSSAIYFVDYLRLIARQHGMTLPIDFIPLDTRKDAKITRIALCEGLLRNKMLKFFHGLPRWERCRDQFVKFGGSRHDDYPDTVALMAKTFGADTVSRPVPRPTPKNIMDALMQSEQDGMAQLLQSQSMASDDGNEGFFAI